MNRRNAQTAIGVARFGKIPMTNETLCHIEILKDGHFFIARTETHSGTAKEYKNTVFEDMLTEMVVTLQENLQDVV